MKHVNFGNSILYEDNHLLVVRKPPMIAVQADRSGDRDFLSLLKEDLRTRHGKPGNVYLGLVHRLDRPVGGVMVFAKTSKAAARLGEQVRSRTLRKRYLAVVQGHPAARPSPLVHYIRKNSAENRVTVRPRPFADAKPAELTYEVRARMRGLSLLMVTLKTGRPHQIRAQMAYIGYPVWGDFKYGHPDRKNRGIGLWSYELGFLHPTRKTPLLFHSLPPADRLPWSMIRWRDLALPRS